MTSHQLKSDLEMIQQIDEADVDLPMGLADFIEESLTRLLDGRPLTRRARAKAQALLEHVQQAGTDASSASSASS